MEKHEIRLQNKIYTYTVTRKNIKNCYLKIRNGMIQVTANYFIKTSIIENMIIQNQNKIIQRIESYVPKAQYVHEGYVMIFGKRYTICVIDKKRYQCSINGDIIYVYHNNVKKAFMMYAKDILLQYVTIKTKVYLDNYFDFSISTIIIQDTKSRWGASFYNQSKVSFALSLIHLDYYLIDYVVMHELCHSIEPNHSKRFYSEIEKRMPDYKQRVALLKKETI